MPRYMLDTDTVSYALRGLGRVADRLLEHRPSDLCISSITLAELHYGAQARRSRKIRGAIRAFARDVAVVPFDEAAAEHFGVVAATLKTRGQPSGTFDTLLAAQALGLGLTVVTNNTKHFSRVPGLTVENWV
jgi:tRNA(fMet)-specific endonuclease VapC